MTKEEIVEIRTVLEKADEPTIREIVREAESFLAAQLQAGLASDLRAMTLAVILAAILSFLVGGTASLLAAKIEIGLHVLTVAALLVTLGVALGCAVAAARPTSFDYAGSNPKFWTSDVERNHSLVRSLAGQAAQYADGIAQNSKVLSAGHYWLSMSSTWMVWAIVGAAAIEFVLFLSHVAKTGSIYS